MARKASNRDRGEFMPVIEAREEISTRPLEAELMALASDCGVAGSAVIDVDDIVFLPEFRSFCEDNRCGNYGRNWKCPPRVGDIKDLIANLKARSKAIVFNHVSQLKSPYDWNGMISAGVNFGLVTRVLADRVPKVFPEALVLGAGPCKDCDKCALLTDEPCRHPEGVVTSLEACGVDVSLLAKLSGLKYNNGALTITYFGAVFF
jgi:predicted metal-binding protein